MRVLRIFNALCIPCFIAVDAFASVGFQSFDVVTVVPGTHLFSSIGPMGPPGEEAGPGATAGWAVSIDLALLSTLPATLDVNIPDRGTTTLSKVAAERRGGGNYMWMGRDSDCSILLDVFSDGVKGNISCFDTQYGLDHIQGSSSERLSRYDNSGTSEDDDIYSTSPGIAKGAVVCPATHTGFGDTTVDVLVAFNGTMTSSNIWSIAQYSVDQTQLAMLNSTSPGSLGPIAQLRLAGAARVSRTTLGDPTNDALFIQNTPEGQALRAYWAADVVVMISPGSGPVLGYAQLPGYAGYPSPGPSFAGCAVAAVLQSVATTPGDYVFAHEFAHTFGANHNFDHGTPNPTPVAPYAFGKWARNPEPRPNGTYDGYRTIMSYLEECTGSPCPRILNYSNPDVVYIWFQTGVEDAANNAKLIREIAPIQAQYYANNGRIFADGFQ